MFVGRGKTLNCGPRKRPAGDGPMASPWTAAPPVPTEGARATGSAPSGGGRSAVVSERLWHALVGTRGGVKRARVLDVLGRRPCTTSQLADRLDEEYATVRYHLDVLQEADLVRSSGDDYGAVYFPTEAFEEHESEFAEILEHLDVGE